MRNLGVSENGGLEFKRLIPVNGLADDASVLKAQLDYLRQGLEKHLVLQALLTYYEDADGNKCDMLNPDGQITNESLVRVHQKCTARGTFIIGDFSNGMKDDHIRWITAVQAQMADYEARYGDRVEFLISGEPYFLASMVQELREKA